MHSECDTTRARSGPTLGRLERWLSRNVPRGCRDVLRWTRNRIVRLATLGSGCYCPVCQHKFRRFVTGGVIPRPHAACPVCRCLERDRLAWLYLENKTDLYDGRPKRLLHIAPEPRFAAKFRQVKSLDYLSADLSSPLAMVHFDITSIPYPDESFDVIYCSHVLEHVSNDRQAMAEFQRVLRAGGWAMVMVPIEGNVTHEDPTISTPAARLRAFGQEDHVRIYGADIVDRLRRAGFDVRADAYGMDLDDRQRLAMGFDASEQIFFCRKLAPNQKS